MTDRVTLEAQLAALRKARASGVATVEFDAGNGSRRRVTYRSDAELAAAIADIERQIAGLSGRVHTITIATSKGF
ncbi:phage head-tail joining protein [Prosthecomicrobium sp. N25]|uniref:phage head-tail joining protein n=1 Tax=Prosthecomicrobium sp. N25 TaxID=3129254 RepID=UPI003076CD2D